MDGYITIGTVVDTSDLDKAIKELETKSKRTEKETSIKAKAELDTTQAEKGLDNLERKADKTGKNVSVKLSKGFMVGMSALNVVVQKIAQGISGSMDEAISRVDTLNNYTKVMGNLGIKADDASVSLNRMSDALLGLPTTLDQGALAVQRFTSANGDIKTSTEMFLALNNAILAGGAATNIQSMALEQMSQAYAKGKPDMMEWKSIMTAMPAQLKQIAIAMNYASAADLGEALRKGDESMNNFMATIIKLNKEGANGFKSLDEQARNATGGIRTSLTNLKTTIARAMADIINAVGQSNIAEFFDKIKNAIIAVTPYIAGFVKAIMMLFGKGTKKETDNTTGGIENLNNAIGGTTSGVEEATDAVKDLNKELNKTASFDEMNILQQNKSSSGSGDTGVGATGGLGNLDFSEMGNNLSNIADKTQEIAEKIQKWLKPIIEHWKELAGAIVGAKVALDLFKLGLDGIKSVGIGLAIAGVIMLILDLISYLNDPSFENFGNVIKDIGLSIIGLGVAIGSVPVIIVGAITAIWGLIVKNWEKIKEFLQSGIDWLKEKSDWIHKHFGETIGKMYDNFVKTIQDILDWLDEIMKGIKKNFDEIIDFVKNVFSGKWKEAWQNVKNIFSNIWDAMKKTAMAVFNAILNLGKNIGISIGNAIATAFKNVVNSVLQTIENILNGPIRTINSLIDVINAIPGINLGKLPTFNLPRLAKGGIVNLPGRGVPVGGALAGEVSQEGVIPLTDSQQMQLLGEAIGRYITVNASITNTMNGRVISRELQKINNENDFAFNK